MVVVVDVAMPKSGPKSEAEGPSKCRSEKGTLGSESDENLCHRRRML